jgi:hypothetical protein
VGIFVQEVMLDFPGIVESQTVSEDDLLECLLKEPVFIPLVPRLR